MVPERTASLKNALQGMIHVMDRTIEINDPCTADRQQRVADLAVAMAEKMNLFRDQIEGIHMAHRPAFGVETALMEISRNQGVLNDTGAVDACLSLFKDGEFRFD